MFQHGRSEIYSEPATRFAFGVWPTATLILGCVSAFTVVPVVIWTGGRLGKAKKNGGRTWGEKEKVVEEASV
jgi:hypothetical protein